MPFEVHAYARPYGAGTEGGDRVAASYVPGGVAFLLADMAHHGSRAAASWEKVEEQVERAWCRFLHARGAMGAVEPFAHAVNDACYVSETHLCVTIGTLGVDGLLRAATHGFGVHLLPYGPTGLRWSPAPETLFGLKLGWVPTHAWSGNARGFVGLQRSGIRDLVILSDGFLRDDHREPQETLRRVEALGHEMVGLSAAERLEHVLRLRHGADDASVLTVGRASAPGTASSSQKSARPAVYVVRPTHASVQTLDGERALLASLHGHLREGRVRMVLDLSEQQDQDLIPDWLGYVFQVLARARRLGGDLRFAGLGPRRRYRLDHDLGECVAYRAFPSQEEAVRSYEEL
jgi:hypothetical protein